MNQLVFVILLFVAATQFSGIPAPPKQPVPAGMEHCTLGVPSISQKGHYLCWAACTEMIMKYYHDHEKDTNAPVWSQCQLARTYFSILYSDSLILYGEKYLYDTSIYHCPCDTCPSGIPPPFDITGPPFLYQKYALPFYNVQLPDSVNWDVLRSAIDSRQPVIFEWYAAGLDSADAYNDAGAHAYVAEGYSRTERIGTSRWVSVNDSWPRLPGDYRGHHVQMAYNQFNYSSRGFSDWSTGATYYAQGQIYIIGKQ